MSRPFHGPLAALLTPRTNAGVDLNAFGRLTRFVLDQGVTGVVVAGGTGEYAQLREEEHRQIHKRAVAAAAGKAPVIACPGAADFSTAVALAGHALDCGCQAVLLPPPHFYAYSQDDLESFFREAARLIHGPVLLYNLSAFTTPISTDLALRLIESVPNIVGVKDSSGNLEILEALTDKPELEACRILGHDRVLVEALRSGCLDATISGPAGVVPELSVALLESFEAGDLERREALAALFDELVARFAELPYPWMPLLIAEWRGFFPARFPLPLSPRRIEQARTLKTWFRDWSARLAAMDVAVASPA